MTNETDLGELRPPRDDAVLSGAPPGGGRSVYAVIESGGKQHRVEQGQRLEVDRLTVAVGDELTVRPVLVVDGDNVLATPDQLSGASVSARVVGEAKGPKITGFTYKAKSRQRRRWGHRQRYTTIEITGISPKKK